MFLWLMQMYMQRQDRIQPSASILCMFGLPRHPPFHLYRLCLEMFNRLESLPCISTAVFPRKNWIYEAQCSAWTGLIGAIHHLQPIAILWSMRTGQLKPKNDSYGN
jgi:hypothetical protein